MVEGLRWMQIEGAPEKIFFFICSRAPETEKALEELQRINILI